MSTWGPEGPPDDAYERVTDSERFRGLHRAGRDLLIELESIYQVRREGFLDHDRPHGPEPAERLVPTTPGASALALTYTEAPGLVVTWGRGQRAHLPMCACDACEETVESCLDQLAGLVDPVVAGTFGEALTLDGGRWSHRRWSSSSTSRSESVSPVDDDQAEQLLTGMPDGERLWRPWTRRAAHTPG